MSAVWNNENKAESLQAILDSAALADAKLLLFDTIAAIDDEMTYAEFEADEVSFTGYARQDVGSWSAPTISAHRALSLSGIVAFTNSGVSPSSSITGWALVDEAEEKVIIAGLYDSPFVIAAGGTYSTALLLTFRGEQNSAP